MRSLERAMAEIPSRAMKLYSGDPFSESLRMLSAEEKGQADPDWLAARLGVEPSRCVVFEDAAAGIQAAHAGGMKAVGIGNPDLVRGCDLFARTLADVTPSQIRALFAS